MTHSPSHIRDVNPVAAPFGSTPSVAQVAGVTPSAPAAAIPTTPQKLRLPPIKDALKLIELINNLPGKLQAERDVVLARIQRDELQLVDLDRTIAALQQLPQQIEIEQPDPSAAIPMTSPNGETRWHRDYDRCLDCGRKDRPYSARGYCKTCYPKHSPSGEARASNGQR